MGKRMHPFGAQVGRRAFLRGTAALGAGLAASSFPRRAVPAPAPKKATVRLNWTAKGEFTPLYVAREKGFFAEQGLEVEILEGKSGTQAVQVVGTGNDTFGFVPSIQVVQGINQGIPVKVTGTFGRVTGMCWASWPEVPLTGPKSLEGRKVSMSSASTFFQVWPAFAKKHKLDLAKIETVNADPSARNGLFLSRRLDIMADIFVANDFVILESRAKQKLNMLRLSDLDFDPVGYVLIVHRPVAERDPDLVKRFTRATQKGFQYLLDSPKDAIAIMNRLYGERFGPEVIDGQVTRLITLVNREPAVGVSSDGAWQRSLDLLHEAGVIDKKLPLAEYFTNDFLNA
jgi:NitT/TauT family transport system substrate-binding protein